MPLTKLQFRPGINREVTSYTNEGGWVDGDRIRFRAGSPETIGGWTRVSENPMLGVCRAMINWNTLTGATLLGLGTNLKYYIGRGGSITDVTPIRLTTSAGAVTFSATDGSDVLTVTHTAHGARDGDFVTFSGAASLGGVVTAPVLNAEHQITEILNANSYTITLPVTANASDTGDGGASVVGAYQIRTGLASTFRGDGWGADSWGAGGWGEAADSSVEGEQLRLWSHTTYGEDLIINPRGGALYYWDFLLGFSNNRAARISTMSGADQVPAQCNIVRLSEQDRHVLAFGCTPLGGGALDPLLIRFSAQENFLDWNPTSTNTAGDLRISSGNQILAVEQTSQQMLALTDTSAHVVQFVGPPFTFGIREVASGISTAGPNAAVAANDAVFWMGLGEFYLYDGRVRQIPCPVKEFVFDLTLDMPRSWQIYAGHNAGFSEVWWFYPSKLAGEGERYVVYNYEQDVWYYGALPRTAWVDRGVSLNPLAAADDGYIYAHETGASDGSQNPPVSINSYVQSSPIDLGDGEQFMFVTRVIPDLTFRASGTGAEVMMTLTAQNFPGGSYFGDQTRSVDRTVEFPVEQYTEQLHVRIRGRAMAMRVGSATAGTAWRLGSPRVDVRTDGRR